MDLSRRNFMLVGTTSLFNLPDGLVSQVEQTNTNQYQFRGVADLLGPEDALPTPGDGFFDNKIAFAYRYRAQDTGREYFIEDGNDSWTELPTTIQKVSQSNLPSATEAPTGALYLLDETRTPVWNDGDAWETATFTDDVLLTDETVANTTTETTVYSDDVDAGSLLTGRILSARVMGNYSTVNNSATLNIRFYVEGTEVATISNIGQNVSDAPLSAQMYATIREGGDGGEISAHTLGRVNGEILDQNQQTVMLSLSSASTVEVTAQWSEVDPGNEVVITQAFTALRNYNYPS